MTARWTIRRAKSATGGRYPAAAALILAAGCALVVGLALVGLGFPTAAQAVLPAGGTGTGHILFVEGDSLMTMDLQSGVRRKLVQSNALDSPGQPSLATNGAAMAFVRFAGGVPTLEYQRQAGPLVTRVLDEWQEGTGVLPDPAFSSDGLRLLYIVEEVDPGGGFRNTLKVYDPVTEDEVDSIENADAGDWFPGGTKLVYLSYVQALARADRVGLFVYDTISHSTQPVPGVLFPTDGEVNLYSPRMSLGGAWIAYLDDRNDTVQVRLTNPAGTVNQLVRQYPSGQIGLGLRWVRVGGVERLLVERTEAGGGPSVIEEVWPGNAGQPFRRILHGVFGPRVLPQYTDVGESDPNRRIIRVLGALGIMQGFTDGTFGGAQPVRRAQYAKIISVATGLHDGAWTGWSGATFPDVPRPATQTESARYPFDYVQEAKGKGLIQGKADGLFYPWDDISRAQLALMIARAGTGVLAPATAADYAAFKDTTTLSQEARDAIAICYHNGIIKGKAPGLFGPYSSATRNHVALMTWRFMKISGWVVD